MCAYVLADFNQPLFITHLMNGLHEEGRRQKKSNGQILHLALFCDDDDGDDRRPQGFS